VRPERFTIHNGGAAIRIASVMPYYAERFALCEVRSTAGEAFQVSVPLEILPQAGDTLHVVPNVDALLYFDPATGRRIG